MAKEVNELAKDLDTQIVLLEEKEAAYIKELDSLEHNT